MNETVEIEKILREDYKLFVDTCSLLHTEAGTFFYNYLAPLLCMHKKKIILPKRVIQEIDRLKSHYSEETRNLAEKASKIILEYMVKNIAEIRGEQNDPFADGVFLYVFTRYRLSHNLALLTQDVSLAKDIGSLGNFSSAKSNKQIKILKLDPKGNPIIWKFDRVANDNPAPSETYRKCTRPISTKPAILSCRLFPKEADIILTSKYGNLKLLSLLGEGGEGRIYKANNAGLVCKVFNEKRITDQRQNKLNLMLTKPIVKFDGICWPLDLARNTYGEFIGYLMPMARGKPMQTAMFVKQLLIKNFPTWTRKNLVNLCLTILKIICHLHERNILLGDINPFNIHVVSDTEVYFVDTDSYQIEEFPSPVGTTNFTAPEIMGKPYDTFLREPEQEYFALATLLFMILLPGKPPYSHQGGGDPAENIKNRDFSYPLGGKSNNKSPHGPWRFIWSNLPYKTKEAFYHCFAEGKRINTEHWSQIIKGYQSDIGEGFVTDELFPTTFKKISKHAHDEFGAPEDVMRRYRCSKCSKEFDLPAGQTQRGSTHVCYECSQEEAEKRRQGKMQTCINCGKPFFFSIAEKEFFKSKSLDLPKRCPVLSRNLCEIFVEG